MVAGETRERQLGDVGVTTPGRHELGADVITTRTGSCCTRSISIPSAASVVGSIQCTSS